MTIFRTLYDFEPRRMLDLFSGTKSICQAFREHGFETLSLDLDPKFEPDICIDIMEWDHTEYPPRYFSVIWASPPCEKFSGCNHYECWRSKTVQSYEVQEGKKKKNILVPKDGFEEEARRAVSLLRRAWEIISYFEPDYWYIENPRAAMRVFNDDPEAERPWILDNIGMPRTITYCQYGDNRRKPTDIWGTFPRQFPVRCCEPYRHHRLDRDWCHAPTPRGSTRTGTLSDNSVARRARIPDGFANLLVNHIVSEMR